MFGPLHTVSVSRVFDGTSFKTAVNLLARNGVGTVKTHGGDQWISRIMMRKNIGEMVTRKIILMEKLQDFNNGSYLLICPDLQKYLKEFTITVEVYLEYSSETIEALRYMMSTNHALNRQFAVKITLRETRTNGTIIQCVQNICSSSEIWNRKSNFEKSIFWPKIKNDPIKGVGPTFLNAL